MIVPSQLALKTHTNFGCAACFATCDNLLDRFPLPPVLPPIGDTSLTHVMRLSAHSTTPATPTAMGQHTQHFFQSYSVVKRNIFLQNKDCHTQDIKIIISLIAKEIKTKFFISMKLKVLKQYGLERLSEKGLTDTDLINFNVVAVKTDDNQYFTTYITSKQDQS
jgi:hypothetical protein